MSIILRSGIKNELYRLQKTVIPAPVSFHDQQISFGSINLKTKMSLQSSYYSSVSPAAEYNVREGLGKKQEFKLSISDVKKSILADLSKVSHPLQPLLFPCGKHLIRL